MKVLVIHNFHRKGSSSGDDVVFKQETALLENHGYEIIRYSANNDSFDDCGLLGKVKSVFAMFWSFEHYKNVKKIIRAEKPDIVHVHTFFPLLSPSVLYAAKKYCGKVVATLHDTRFVCPCATSLRNGHLCNECGDGQYFRMCRYGCFKNSKIKSFIVAAIFYAHRYLKSFYRKIDKYICLNNNQICLLKNIGFDESKLIKKYNFVPDANDIADRPDDMEGIVQRELPERYIVFYGRIGEEKGIHVLQEIWERLSHIPLVVMGGGPLQNEFKLWASEKAQVYYLGYTPHNKCLSVVKRAEFVVFPSIWYEGCSMVEIESESLGKGLVATDLGFSAEAIENGVNGFKIPLGDVNGFVDKIEELWNNPYFCEKLGENARKDYEKKYMPEENFEQLKSIYESL